MNHGKGKFHFVFKTQCILPPPCPISGAAYFGITSSDNPFYGQDGTYPYAGEGKKLVEAIRQYGAEHFRVTIEGGAETDFSKAKARLEHILNQVRGHPLSLNLDNPNPGPQTEEHRQALSLAFIDNKNAIAHVVTDEARKQISENLKKKKLKWIHNKKTREEFQIEKGEDLLTGFQFGRLPGKLRKMGPKKNRMDISKMSDAERARLPEFVLKAMRKQEQENVNEGN